MNQSIETCSDEEHPEGESTFFRCPIQQSDGKAMIRVGRKRIPVTVQETSIDGFTLMVAAKHASQIQISGPWELEFADARTEVHPQWIFNAPDGNAQLAVRRLRDLTKPDPIRSTWWTPFRQNRYKQSGNGTIAFGGFILAFIALLGLPGFGEKLGSAHYIQSAIVWVYKGIHMEIKEWW
ncbi:hypothetical protein SH528x_005251 [Novipirellula sp. SH528]|uniref:hypothetical protein n=1 Tax=Novipirellula sp. SH528 TaxID=3454466 RepID=UPI003FA00006